MIQWLQQRLHEKWLVSVVARLYSYEFDSSALKPKVTMYLYRGRILKQLAVVLTGNNFNKSL